MVYISSSARYLEKLPRFSFACKKSCKSTTSLYKLLHDLILNTPQLTFLVTTLLTSFNRNSPPSSARVICYWFTPILWVQWKMICHVCTTVLEKIQSRFPCVQFVITPITQPHTFVPQHTTMDQWRGHSPNKFPCTIELASIKTQTSRNRGLVLVGKVHLNAGFFLS